MLNVDISQHSLFLICPLVFIFFTELFFTRFWNKACVYRTGDMHFKGLLLSYGTWKLWNMETVKTPVCVCGCFEKLSCVYFPYLSPGLDIIMKCFVCRVHYCYSRAGEVIHALISHQRESVVHWDHWFIQAFNGPLFCFFCHLSKMSSKEKRFMWFI